MYKRTKNAHNMNCVKKQHELLPRQKTKQNKYTTTNQYKAKTKMVKILDVSLRNVRI